MRELTLFVSNFNSALFFRLLRRGPAPINKKRGEISGSRCKMKGQEGEEREGRKRVDRIGHVEDRQVK
jgi:hypothetical protein